MKKAVLNYTICLGRLEARNPTCTDYGYPVEFRLTTRPTVEWNKNN